MGACSRCSARYYTAGLANTTGGNRNELARCCSRNTLTKLSYAYLVKSPSLLPGPGKGERIRSVSSDPHKLYICANTSKRRRRNSSRPDLVMVSASNLASERMHLDRYYNNSIIGTLRRARHILYTDVSIAQP